MSTPPTAERPTGAPASAPASPASPAPPGEGRSTPPGRSGKGRAGRGRTTGEPGAGRGGGPTAPAAPTGPGPSTAPAAPTGAGRDEAARLIRQLTPREAQALAHLAADRDLDESAAALGVTPATLRRYQHRALRKLGTRTRTEIAAFAALLSPAQTAPDGTATPAPDAARTGAPEPPAEPARGGGRAARPGTAKPDGTTRRRRTTATPAPDTTEARHARPRRAVPGPPDGHPGTTAAATATTAAAATATAPDRPEAAEPVDGPRERPRPKPAEPAPPNGHAKAAATPPEERTGPPTPATPPADRRRQRERPAPPDRRPGTPAAPPPQGGRPGGGAPRTAPVREGAEPPARTAAPAFGELYEAAHTRLVQQVFLLTACKHRSVHCVQRAFGEARRRWDEVAVEPDPEGWVRARAFEAALSPWHRGGPRRAHVWRLPHRRIKVRPADESQAVLPDHDRLTDRDRALLKALKRLSRPQRRALVLHDGLGLPAAAVAVEVESTVAAAEGRVWAARTALTQWVPELAGPDPTADGFADRLSGLLHRAAVRGCPQPHRAPVPLLRARYGLAGATRTGAAALLTLAVAGAVGATLAGGGPSALFRPGDDLVPVVCGATANGAAVPAPPDAPPTGVRSLWCSPTPGVEAVVLDPPPPRPARPGELPGAGRAAEALPPRGPAATGPVSCTRWALHPCATDG
ncbi:LuxR C-terminal-related transcriptional regulator [Kitasatospora sp. NPDC127111]|uniref:LuxR C-terminal-related transcriptional regulator n=1 Tax=Kitasatospora sp. NPDC127111 TaxID=3345363 RepID=UPI00364097D5